MDYTQLDKTQRLNAIRDRIRDLEQQHMMVALRVNTPSVTDPPTDQDKVNMDVLESSLDALHQMEAELAAS